MKLLATTMLVASVAFSATVTVDAAGAQTKTYQSPKPRAPPSNVRPGKGYDPDPFIAGEILRHRNSGWPD